MSTSSFAQAREYLEEFLGYQFTDAVWLQEALYAGGPTVISGRRIPQGNKRLAWVGDAALYLVVSHAFYTAGAPRGEAHESRKAIICNANLDMRGRAAGLEKFVVLEGGTVAVSLVTMATTVETILGALFEDSDGDLTVVKGGVLAFGLLTED